MRYFLCLFFVSLMYSSFAVEKNPTTQNAPATQIKYPPRDDFDMLAFDETIKSKLNEFSNKIKSTKIKWPDYQIFSSLVLAWYNHPYTEEATRINKTWFKDLSVLAEKLSKIKRNMELAEDGKDAKSKEIYDKDKAEYDKVLKVFKETLAKPPKFSDEDYKKLLEQIKKNNPKKKQ